MRKLPVAVKLSDYLFLMPIIFHNQAQLLNHNRHIKHIRKTQLVPPAAVIEYPICQPIVSYLPTVVKENDFLILLNYL